MGEETEQHTKTQNDLTNKDPNFSSQSIKAQETMAAVQEMEWMDILGNGQLKKKVIRSGINGTRPQRGDLCVLKIIGKLKDGTIVEDYDNITVQCGDVEVIQGLDLAIALMDKEEIAEIEVDPRFAYGKLGREPDIPADAVITYLVTLLDAVDSDDMVKLNIKRRKNISNKKRERGNWWYKRDEPSLAIQCYRRALEFLIPCDTDIYHTETGESATDAELQELLENRTKVYNNLAAAQIKIQSYDAALESVNNVLNCEPQNVKALFRKGKILHFKGEHNRAYTIFLQADKLDPESLAIKKELAVLKEKIAKDTQHEKNLYRKMLGTNKIDNSKNVKKENNTNKVLWSIIGASAVIVSIFMYKCSL